MANLKNLSLICKQCGTSYPYRFQLHCTKENCKGFIFPEFSTNNIHFQNKENPLERFFDILPIPSFEDAKYFGVQNTRLLHAKELGRKIGLDSLYIKCEGDYPTGTTKDRINGANRAFLASQGIESIACSSTGSNSSSLAESIRQKPGLKATFILGPEFLTRHHQSNDIADVKLFLVDGNYEFSAKVAKNYAKSLGLKTDGRARNFAKRAAAGTAVLEAIDQVGHTFDWFFQAVSSGMGLISSYEMFQSYKDLGRIATIPRIVACEENSNAGMYSAWNEGSPIIREKDKIKNPNGLVKAILRGDKTETYPEVYAACSASGGNISIASSIQILLAQKLAQDYEGISMGEPSALALASIIHMTDSGKIKQMEKVLLLSTGKYIPEEAPSYSFSVFPSQDFTPWGYPNFP